VTQIDALRKQRHHLLDTQSRARALELLDINELQNDRKRLVGDLDDRIDRLAKQIHDLAHPDPKDVLGKMVDVSGAQGSVDWRKMAAAGVRVASIKVDEGVTYADPTFSRERLTEMRDAGLARGVYHFARPDNNGGAAEAEAFVRRVEAAGGSFVSFSDWRNGGAGIFGWLDFEHTPYSASFARDWGQRFAQLTKVKPGIYGGGYSLNPIAPAIPGAFSAVWIAAYANSWQPYLDDHLEPLVRFWQYTSAADIGGEHPVDVSRYID
jgi:GH25 family lysozyme M1 (1,4-beta-N-acetylmuramidase)